MNRATFQFSLSAHDQAEPDSSWQLLLPAGQVMCRDGRGPYLNNPDTVLGAFAQWAMPIDVDYHHQSLSAEQKAGLVPSAGSVVELANRNGEVWGRFEWTATSAAAIAAKEVKYLSPVFDYEKDSLRITQLVSVGLTNQPNLYLNPLSVNSLGGTMDEIVERLCYMLNLPITSTPEEIKGHLQRLIDSIGGSAAMASDAMSQLGTSLGLGGDAKWSDVLRTAHNRLVPGATIPVAEFNRVSHELNTLKQIAHTAEVDKEVCAARASGKLAPSMEAWARDYASQDLAGFKRWANDAVAVIPSGEIVPSNPPNQPPDASYVVPAGYGVNQEKLAKHRAAMSIIHQHDGDYLKALRAVG